MPQSRAGGACRSSMAAGLRAAGMHQGKQRGLTRAHVAGRRQRPRQAGRARGTRAGGADGAVLK